MEDTTLKQRVPFTQIANEVLYNKELSLKAKGLFAYLFSKPSGWSFSSERIRSEHTDGQDSILSGLKELEDMGYLERNRKGDGRMEYYLKWKKPLREKPNEGNSLSGKIGTVSNTDSLSKTHIDNNTDTMSAFEEFWKEYPKKELKKRTKEIWNSKNLDRKYKEIVEFITEAKKTDRWKKGFVKQPPVFLNGECWNDDLSSYNDRKQQGKELTIKKL